MMWGGRFSNEINPFLESINRSIKYDQRLWKQDIQGSKAYVKCLLHCGLVNKDEEQDILFGLDQIHTEWSTGKFQIQDSDEDIHSANERRLKEIIGEAGGKLHTGRSRNDQVVTDTRLWALTQIDQLKDKLSKLVASIVVQADRNIDVICPGYTHMQRAQPIRWSHWLLSYAFKFKRDYGRLLEIRKSVNISPLGSGALAGNPFSIDRNFLAQELGFTSITENSIDAVSDRDFVCEILFWTSLLGVHLSNLAEDMLLYSTKEYNFLAISDAFCTGSSLMPQKCNADSLEIIRSKAGRLIGHCTGFMSTLKGLPSSYNKDLQEDKEALFDSCLVSQQLLDITTGVISSLTVNKKQCSLALSPDMLATDLANYLVRKGIPFRDAHLLSGECVVLAERSEVSLDRLPLSQLQSVSLDIKEDVLDIWDYAASVEQYTSVGGTSYANVKEQIQALSNWLESISNQ